MLTTRRSKKMPSGKRYKKDRKKRLYEKASLPTHTLLDEKNVIKKVRVMGGNYKIKLKRTNYVNVAIPKEKKIKKAKLTNVIENPADPQLTRRNIITKNAIVETEIGRVRITSRPGQDGVLNGVLIEEEK